MSDVEKTYLKTPKVLNSISTSDDQMIYRCVTTKNDRESLKEVIDLLELSDNRLDVEITCEKENKDLERQFEEKIKPALQDVKCPPGGRIQSIEVYRELDLEPAFWNGIPLDQLKATLTMKIELDNGDKVIIKSQDFKYEEKYSYKREESDGERQTNEWNA